MDLWATSNKVQVNRVQHHIFYPYKMVVDDATTAVQFSTVSSRMGTGCNTRNSAVFGTPRRPLLRSSSHRRSLSSHSVQLGVGSRDGILNPSSLYLNQRTGEGSARFRLQERCILTGLDDLLIKDVSGADS